MTEGRFRTPKGNAVVFEYRENTSDWNTLNACATEDEYGLAGLSPRSVLDVGGHLGGVAVAVAVDNPEARVTVIEPVPANAALLRHNAERNGVELTVIEGAAGAGGETVEVWYGYRGTEVAEHHAFIGNSSLAYDHGGTLEHDTQSYTATGLAELVGDGLDLLKIDCEGGEWAFLASPAVSGVERIVGEAHAVRGHRGRDMAALLAATHDVTFTGDPEATCGFTAVRR